MSGRQTLLILWAAAAVTAPRKPPDPGGLSLWIGGSQVEKIAGVAADVYVVADGSVSPLARSPGAGVAAPVVPTEVDRVDFTWESGPGAYAYHFVSLESSDEAVLGRPTVSIKRKGTVPRAPRTFAVSLPCGNGTGTASFRVRLVIEPLPAGAPLVLSLGLKKECLRRAADPDCGRKCGPGGRCKDDVCLCRPGYGGERCADPLCFPPCMNGGTCSAPGTCACPRGYRGRLCEGGVCFRKCENGGKCVGKDACKCPKWYAGSRCQLPRCRPPCLNGGRCSGRSSCACRAGYSGPACERFSCECRRGACAANGTACVCEPGWEGPLCRVKIKKLL